MTDTIKTGDIVRSHDFDSREITGPRASYVIGVVTEIDEYSYTIDVHARVCSNEPVEVFRPFVVRAPITGRPSMFGKLTDGVVKL